MALAIDGSTPTLATSSTATVTSASFTPPDNALLVVAWAANNPTGSDPSAPSITDDLGVPLTYTLSNWRNRADLSPNHVDGQTAIWTAPVPTSQPMSVSVTNGAASSRHAALKIWVVTGADPDTPLGAEGEASSLSAGSISQDYTAEATSSQGFMVACDWDTLGAMTEGSGCTFDHTGDIAGQISYGFLRRTTDDGSLGATTTLACTLSGTSTNLSWVWVELIPAAVNEDLIDPPPFLRHFPAGQPPPTNFLKPWFGADQGAGATSQARTAPTFPDAQDLAEGNGTRSFAAVTCAANDWVVVQVVGEDGGATALVDVTPSCAGLSFTKQVDAGASGDTRHQIWTAPDGSGGSRTVQLTPSPSATRTYRARVTVVRGSEGPGGFGSSLTAATASVTRTKDNSAVFMQVGDWSTGAVGSPVWTPGGSTTASQQGANATYIFGRYNDAGTAGTANHGISSPSYTTPSAGALEIFGQATAGGNATASPAVIAAVTAMAQANINTTVGATAASIVVALPQAAAGSPALVTPAAVATTTTLPQPNINISAGPAVAPTTTAMVRADVNVTASPAVLPTTATVPQPNLNISTGPAVVQAVVALPRTNINTTVGATVIPVVVALPAAGVNTTVGATVIPVVVSLPQAAPQAGGNATASPAAIVCTVALARANLNTAAGPAVVPAVVTIPQPAVNTAAGPLVLQTSVALPAAHPNTAAGPAVVTVSVAVPAAAVNVAAGPSTIPVVVTLPLAEIGGQTAKATSVAATAAVVGSVAAVQALRAASSAVASGRSSTPGVSAARTATSGVAADRTSTSEVT